MSFGSSFLTELFKVAATASFDMPAGSYKDGRPRTKKVNVPLGQVPNAANTGPAIPAAPAQPAPVPGRGANLDPMANDQIQQRMGANLTRETIADRQAAAGRRPLGKPAKVPVPASRMMLNG